MPSQELARQAAILVRQFVAFLLERIIRLIPHRLIPRTKSFSWKLAVPRPPAILSEYGHSSYMEYRGFDQWIANTRENTGVIVTEVPRRRFGDHITHLRPRIASWGYAPPPSPSSSDDSRNY